MADKIILLVEDEPDDVELTLNELSRVKIANEVVVARDGQEALDYLFAAGRYAGRDAAQLPVVVFLDLHLPKVDGAQVLRRIRAGKATRLLPVVVLTTSRDDRELVKCYESGANSFVQKPVSFAEFSKAVRELGLYWLLRNETPPPPRRDAA